MKQSELCQKKISSKPFRIAAVYRSVSSCSSCCCLIVCLFIYFPHSIFFYQTLMFQSSSCWWERRHRTCSSASLFSFSLVGNIFTEPLWIFKVKCLCSHINVCADTDSISAPWMSMRQAHALFHWAPLVTIRPWRAAEMNENSKQIKKIVNKWEGNEAFFSAWNWWQQNTPWTHLVTSKQRYMSEALPAVGRY